MPLKINELVIQAKFEDEGSATFEGQKATPLNFEMLKEDILKECMEKVEEYLKKREIR